MAQHCFDQAEWGISVVAIESGKLVYNYNGDKLMKPASSAKLYTASLVLDRLGPDFRIKTSFYSQAKPDAAGTIHGDLVVYGRGDPTFSARFNNGDYSRTFDRIVEALASAGIKRIEGNLVGDDSYFRGAAIPGNWTWGDLQNSYGVPASALSFEDNVFKFTLKPGEGVGKPGLLSGKTRVPLENVKNQTRTVAEQSQSRLQLYRAFGSEGFYVSGSIPLDSNGLEQSLPVCNPALWFVDNLKQTLTDRGIVITGKTRSINWLDREATSENPTKWVEIASVSSCPVGEIVKETLKSSYGLGAQLLLLQVAAVGKAADPAATGDSLGDALEEMRKFMEEVGIKRGAVLLDEGTGLSRACLITPNAATRLLIFMTKHRFNDWFLTSLPIAGVDGTLRSRFKETDLENHLQAKTGTLLFIDSLTGYLTTKGGDKLAFSVMINNYKPTGRSMDGRAAVDGIVELLGSYSGKIP